MISLINKYLNFKNIKKNNKLNIYLLILIFILIFAFILRLYHVGYPTTGYMNIKEGETLSFADNMFKDSNYYKTMKI